MSLTKRRVSYQKKCIIPKEDHFNIFYYKSCYLFLYFQVGGVSLTWVTSWSVKVLDMCDMTAGGSAVRMGGGMWGGYSPEIRMLNRQGKIVTTINKMCECKHANKHISELIAGQYLATSCLGCNTVKVVDTRTHEVVSVYSGGDTGCELYAMCSAGEGSLLIYDWKSKSVIQLKFNEQRKVLEEVRPRIHVPGYTVYNMCYMPHADLLILSRGGTVVEAVKMHGGAGQPPVWQLKGEVLGKKITPQGVSCDSEGQVYVTDRTNRRVLLLNGYIGEVIQQLLQDDGLGEVDRVCCLSNPHQLLVSHGSSYRPDNLSLYNSTSQ